MYGSQDTQKISASPALRDDLVLALAVLDDQLPAGRLDHLALDVVRLELVAAVDLEDLDRHRLCSSQYSFDDTDDRG